MNRDTLPMADSMTTLMFVSFFLFFWPAGLAYSSEDERFTFLQAYVSHGEKIAGHDAFQWDGEGWIGNDLNKFLLKSKGVSPGNRVEEAEVQALYSRYLTAFWDLLLGVRRDFEPGVQNDGVLGVQGLAPYFLETSLAAFVSTEGGLSGRADVQYDILFTQRLIGQLYFTGNVHAQNRSDSRTGAGLSDIDTGFRIRYEFIHELAPYLDFNYGRLFGRTADFAMAEGRDANKAAIQAGVRFWF